MLILIVSLLYKQKQFYLAIELIFEASTLDPSTTTATEPKQRKMFPTT